jgi:nitrite reductase (NO-forming)
MPLSPRRALAVGPFVAFLVLTAIACGRRDPYDESQMDLHPAPATVSAVRHTGEFAQGRSLSEVPNVAPLDPAPVKTVQLDVVDQVIDLAPGVKFSAWTFGGRVPGPILHARVGDRIRFSMTNRSDETVPGAPSLAMPMMHSMDFHAAMVSPTDKYRSIAPGQTITFEFQLNYPGVFMYHCGTPMILEHIASGMYGVLIVEPRGGYPTRVDRQYVIVQSEFYTKPDPDGRRIDGQPLYVLDTQKVRTKESTYTVFNGVYNGMVDHPLAAKPGERVRLYVLNVGPSNTSSFHVVGEIFDRVWIDGNPDNQFRGMQTVLLPSAGSAIVEFRVPEKGQYVMVDHHFANASQGAVGIIDATGATPERTAADIEHHNIPAVAAMPTDPEAAKGKMQFETKCLACHTLGQGPKIGPDLKEVAKRRTDDWLRRWLQSPETMLLDDPIAKEMRTHYALPMPNQQLSPDDISQLVRYFHWLTETPQVH